MSKNEAHPHTVKVYGYEGEGEKQRLILFERKEFPSRCSADLYASDQRKRPEVSSAIVIRV